MGERIISYDSVDVFVGVDVGKGEHHAVALDKTGKRLFDKALPNDEKKLRELIGGLKEHGTVLFVVDQPNTVGALPVTVAYDEGVVVGYLPGLAMRRIAEPARRRSQDRRKRRGHHRRSGAHHAPRAALAQPRGRTGERTLGALWIRRRPRDADHRHQQPHSWVSYADPPRPGTGFGASPRSPRGR
jgi:hypothetical protein